LHEIGIVLLNLEKGGFAEYELEYANNLLERCRAEIDEESEEYAEWEMYNEGFSEILINDCTKLVLDYERKTTKKQLESTSEITLF